MSKGVTKKGEDKGLSRECLAVLEALDLFEYSPGKIQKHLKISSKTFYKHRRKLIDKKLYVQYDGVTKGGYKLLGYQISSEKYRINGATVYYRLPDRLKKSWWKKNNKRILTQKNITNTSWKLKNKQGQETDRVVQFFYKDRIRSRCHANGVLVNIPDIYGDNPVDAEIRLLLFIEDYGLRLNKIFKKVNFFKDNQLNIELMNYEIAHLDDVLAKQMRREGKTLFIWKEGRLRFKIDYSKPDKLRRNIDEGEALTPDHGFEDITAHTKFQKSVLTEKHYLPGESKILIDQILNIQREQAGLGVTSQQDITEMRRTLSEVADGLKAIMLILKERRK